MHFGTKRAMLMLIAVVLWTAAPLMACVPGVGSPAKHHCCAAMVMSDCGSSSMAGAPCCQLAPRPADAALMPVTSLPQVQEAGMPARAIWLEPMSDSNVGQPGFHEAAPPDPSPGGLSVLRI